MKKIFSLFVALFTVMNMNAQDEVLLFEKNWEGEDYYVFDVSEKIWEGTAEGLAITNYKLREEGHDPITFIYSNADMILERHHDYIVRLTVRVPSDGTYLLILNSGHSYEPYLCRLAVTGSDDFQVVDFEFLDFGDENLRISENNRNKGMITLYSSKVLGTTVLKKVQVLERVKGGETALKSVKSAKTDAAVYNLAGQKVSPSYKGVVIQGGRIRVMRFRSP